MDRKGCPSSVILCLSCHLHKPRDLSFTICQENIELFWTTENRNPSQKRAGCIDTCLAVKWFVSGLYQILTGGNMRGQDSALSANSAKGPIKVEQLTADLQAGLVPKVGAHMISEVDTQIH